MIVQKDLDLGLATEESNISFNKQLSQHDPRFTISYRPTASATSYYHYLHLNTASWQKGVIHITCQPNIRNTKTYQNTSLIPQRRKNKKVFNLHNNWNSNKQHVDYFSALSSTLLANLQQLLVPYDEQLPYKNDTTSYSTTLARKHNHKTMNSSNHDTWL